MYADFEFYREKYKGTKVTADNFDVYAIKADFELDYLTNGRTANAGEMATQVSFAECALIDAIVAVESIETEKPIQSVSSGGESYSYANVQTMAEKAGTDEVMRRKYFLSVIRPYLARTGLLYQGV